MSRDTNIFIHQSLFFISVASIVVDLDLGIHLPNNIMWSEMPLYL